MPSFELAFCQINFVITSGNSLLNNICQTFPENGVLVAIKHEKMTENWQSVVTDMTIQVKCQTIISPVDDSKLNCNIFKHIS